MTDVSFFNLYFSNHRRKERLPSQTIYEVRTKQFPVFVFEIMTNSAGSSTMQLKFNTTKASLEMFSAKILSNVCLNLNVGILLLNSMVTTQIFHEVCELLDLVCCHLIIIYIKTPL